MGTWRAADASQGRTRGRDGVSLRLTLTGVFAGLVVLVPGLSAAPTAAVDDDGIFGEASTVAAGTEVAVVPANFQDSVVFSGLAQPTAVEFATNGRVFVAEKSGVVKVFDSLSDTTPTVLADLNVSVYNFWDRGLLGMALDPANSSLFVLYTYDADIGGAAPKYGAPGVYSDPCPAGATTAGCRVSSRLSRLNASTGAETVLINDWCQQFPSHSIGALAFGADGMLYVSGGDGASFNQVDYGQLGGNLCTDPPNEGGAIRSQDLRTTPPTGDPTTLDGAILRIDPATGAAAPGNPLIGSSDLNARRIIAHGLRNPFRFTIRPGTNEVWLGDVGWSTWEEIDRITDPLGSVENFGWPCYEGAFPASARQSGYDGANIPICESLYAAGDPNVVAPHYAYNHNAQVVSGENCPSGGSSMSGLAFYQGGSYPDNYDGALFFSDYSRGCIWVMFPGGNGLPDPGNRATFVESVGPTELQIGPAGDLFYADYDQGTIRRVQYVEPPPPPPTTGLVAAYSFNEGTGTGVADASDTGNAGTISNATWTTQGKFGNALSFNGTNSRVTVADSNSLDLTTGMTLGAWVNPTALGGWRDVVWKENDVYFLEVSSPSPGNPPSTGGTFGGDVAGQEVVGPAALPLNTWSHLAGTYDGTAIRLYVNGTLVASRAQTGPIATSPSALTMGSDPLYGQAFAGRIDEVRVYNAALTQAQIQADMNTPIGGAPPPDTEPPTAPTNLVATPVSQSQINLGWTASTDPSGVPLYRVERCQGAGCSSFAEIGTTPSNSINNAGLQPVTTYRYRVRAQDGAPTPNLSGYSNIVSATTQGAPNTPPTATISAPASGTLWRVGDTINFSGSATDTEDGGTLPPSRLSWTLVLQHCWQYNPTNCHSHTIQSWPGVASGTFGTPDHEYPAYLELTFTATDSGGLTDTETLRLDPRTAVLTFQTSPSGLQLTVGSSSSAATFTRTVIVGSNNSVSAPSPQTLGGTVYSFVSWSDGGAAAHDIIASASATYTATYQAPVNADLQIVKTGLKDGTAATWTLSVTNLGPSAAQNVVVTDTLHSRLVFVSASPGCSYAPATRVVTCTAASLANGVNSSFTITTTITGNGGGWITNTAQVTSSTADPSTANNTSTDRVRSR